MILAGAATMWGLSQGSMAQDDSAENAAPPCDGRGT
jgi:hypothetical protein